MTQILPGPMMRADEQRIEMTAGSGERAGRRAWLPERAGYGVLTELLAFTHALVGEDVGMEENFNEHTMSHLHLSDYVLPVAESQLLRVSRALAFTKERACVLALRTYERHGQIMPSQAMDDRQCTSKAPAPKTSSPSTRL